MLIKGAMNGEAFLAYIEQCLVPTLNRRDIVVVDNVPFHKAAGVEEAIQAVGASLRFLRLITSSYLVGAYRAGFVDKPKRCNTLTRSVRWAAKDSPPDMDLFARELHPATIAVALDPSDMSGLHFAPLRPNGDGPARNGFPHT
jgi:DDE superfamily endonuclease